MDKLNWSLKDCTVVMTRVSTQEDMQFTGFKEEGITIEYMAAKYDDIENSADGVLTERTANNDTRIKFTFNLYDGTELTAYCDEQRFWDTNEDDVHILVRNNILGRECRADYAKEHQAGQTAWGKKKGARVFEYQAGEGYMGRKVA